MKSILFLQGSILTEFLSCSKLFNLSWNERLSSSISLNSIGLSILLILYKSTLSLADKNPISNSSWGISRAKSGLPPRFGISWIVLELLLFPDILWSLYDVELFFPDS